MTSISEKQFDEALGFSVFSSELDLEARFQHKGESVVDWNYNKDPEIIQREKDRIDRDNLQSQHGDTGEFYDQFYRDHKLLLKLFQVLAVMPIVRSSPGVVSFDWKSNAMIYAVCLYSLITIIVVKTGMERIEILSTTKEFDELIYAIIFVIFLIPHFWIPFVGWGVANQVATYKTMWATFQVRYYRVTGTTLVFPELSMLIIILFVGTVMFAIIFLISLTFLLEGFIYRHTLGYFHIITMINMNCALWFINSKAIKQASKALSHRFRADMGIECKSAVIHKYRLLWLNLSEIVQSLGNAYARTYSTYSLFMCVNVTIAIYGAISEIIDKGMSLKVYGLLFLSSYCIFLLYVFCDCSHKASLEVAQGVQNTLLNLNLLNLDLQTQKEIDLFIIAIEMNPPVVSLRGYAAINRDLLISFFSKIAIYLLVLLQFKLSIVAQNNYLKGKNANG